MIFFFYPEMSLRDWANGVLSWYDLTVNGQNFVDGVEVIGLLNFVYYNPTKVYFGTGVNSQVGEVVGGEFKKVLLLYGSGSAKSSGVYDDVVKSLRASGVDFRECAGVKPNPVLSKIEEAISIIRRDGLEAIVAIGGGSVIDSAKGISAGACYDGDVWDFYKRTAKIARVMPFFAVATLSATASEMNCTSVVTNESLGVKTGLTDNALFPRVTFLDPSVQFSVPAKQIADGGIDAICHVMETYFDGTSGVDVQMEYAEGLVRSLMTLIPDAIRNPRDYDVRAQLAWASANALNGTTWAGHAGKGDFASHAMGHTLSAKYDTVHGESLAIMMPAWMEYVCAGNEHAFARFARRVLGVTSPVDGKASREGIAGMRKFFESLGAPARLRDIGVPAADLPELADSTAFAPIGVLRKLGRDDILAIYRAAF
ncbi:MAG: iron-containing alcohol dehydrogenase [Synergistaceae bacterium]|jgi:alcohol dehydrogenase YqhD (iron-dependent ADH family)|nr:iron-containing alcohol dehydrogenase [Synergistaceae bacterium]